MSERLPMDFGRYRLTERIATGGMAVLYRATLDGAHEFRKHLVIKRIQRDLAVDKDFVAMFIDEAKLTARLHHPKIVQVFELGTLEDELFIAMELVEGTDLLEVMRVFTERKQALDPRIAVHIAREVLDALDYAHNIAGEDGRLLKLVHRDISPGNVLISKRGDVKLADFGIAHAATNQTKTTAGTLKGKYSYMAPEQVVSGELVDSRADVFAVGIVLAEMLMGRRLFTAQRDFDILLMVRDANLSRLDQFGGHLDKQLVAILKRALERDREVRTQTARELRDALEDWLFENHLRVGGRDIAAMVEDVLAARAQARSGIPSGTSPAEARARMAARPTSELQSAVEDDGYEAIELAGETPVPPAPGAPSLYPDLELSVHDFGPALELEPQAPRRSDDEPLDLELLMSDAVPAAGVGPSRASSSMPAIDPEQYPALGSGPRRAAGSGPSRASASTAPTRDPEVFPSTGSAGRAGSGPSRTAPEAFPATGSAGRSGSAPLPRDDFDDTPPPDDFDDTPPPAHSSNPEEELFAGMDAGLSTAEPVEPAGDAPLVTVRFSKQMQAVQVPDELVEDPTTQVPRDFQPPWEEPATTADAALRASAAHDDSEPDGISDLSQIAAIRLLYGLIAQNASGLLVASQADTEMRVYFVDGVPEYVESDQPDDLFGEFLVARNKITRGELAMAMAMLPHFSNELTSALIGLNLLTAQQALDAHADQVRAKLEPICLWRSGTFRWYRDRKIPREWQPLRIDLCAVIGAASRKLDEAFMHEWARDNAQRVMRSAPKPRVAAARYQLGERLSDIQKMLEGDWTIDGIRRLCPTPKAWLDTVRVLYLMEQTDLGLW